jgi:hypothetical protein
MQLYYCPQWNVAGFYLYWYCCGLINPDVRYGEGPRWIERYLDACHTDDAHRRCRRGSRVGEDGERGSHYRGAEIAIKVKVPQALEGL